MDNNIPSIEEVSEFHGHICPGLGLGYRAAGVALEWLKQHRSEDEEIIAIVENRACGIDALQYLLGTTAGKGNFFISDYGKHVYTIANRATGKALRIAVKPKGRWANEGESREETLKRLLEMPAEELFDTREVVIELPGKAEVLQSVVCDDCGEAAMETKIRHYHGRRLCIPCFEAESGLEA
ncbi:MAG: FmdE family protein [Actinomycetota bacterium]|nr:FmdE family protein [Actinomycetota bacterium]